jgi:hypothetical protein
VPKGGLFNQTLGDFIAPIFEPIELSRSVGNPSFVLSVTSCETLLSTVY